MPQIPTAHISAGQGDFAKTVLMPGDPLRAELIARDFLEGAVSVNRTRAMYGYTGLYAGEKVSVMGSGMGVPSMGIYSYELFHFYGVDTIIRIGSAGKLAPELELRDVVLAQGVCTDSHYPAQYGLPGSFAPLADFSLLQAAFACAQRQGIEPVVGNVLTSDVFYSDKDVLLRWRDMGVLAVEMECAALYCNAAAAGKRALGILTISDDPFTQEQCTAQERESGFIDMITLALRLAVEE